MNNTSFELFFSILSVATLIGTVIILIGRLFYKSKSWAATVIDSFTPLARPLAAAIATTAMLGSLYFSEIVNYVPCRLCWYQRIMMYPLAIILIIAAIRRDSKIGWYAVPLASIGASVSTYHWLLERFPNLDAGACEVTVPCEFVWFENFGFVTLPFMAFTGFFAVIVFTTLPIPTNTLEYQ
ncbi:MAG: disulfide oxidoreductase [Ilumatobacteraceae bacterium]